MAAPGPCRFEGFHRYRGVVAGQPVTVELTVTGAVSAGSDPPALKGTLRLAGQPTVLRQLEAWPAYVPGQPLRLVEADSTQPRWRLADWQATGPAGPVLTGSRTDEAGRRAEFVLRENYLDEAGRVAAVPYEVQHLALVRAGGEAMTSRRWAELAARPPTGHERPPSYEPAAMLDQDFLHLLGPDTLRPAVARLQCAAPGRRQAALLARLSGFSDGYEEATYLGVSYDAHGLLSWQEESTNYSRGGAHPNHGSSGYVYDLNDSTYLALADVLQPGAGRALNALLAHHIVAWSPESSPALRGDDGTWWVEPPSGGFSLEEGGLRFTYSDGEIIGFGSIQPNVLISYPELLPLLRPTSPVARMLRARGLWHPAKAR